MSKSSTIAFVLYTLAILLFALMVLAIIAHCPFTTYGSLSFGSILCSSTGHGLLTSEEECE